MEPQPLPTANHTDIESLLSPDEFRALVTRVQKEANRIKFSEQLAVGTLTISVGIFSLGWLWSGSVACELAVVSLLFLYVLAKHLLSRRTRRNEEVVKRLAGFVEDTRDVRHLGTILELHEVVRRRGVAWFELFTAVYHALPRLLPSIRTQHADALNTQQRARLRRDLFPRGVSSGRGYQRDTDYSLDILHALEQIGDKRDLPDIERLLKTHNIPDEIRPAAERCVQTIRERVTREEGKDVLLRADRKPEAVETLLRPSVECDDTPPEQLLRATTSDDGNTPA